MMMNHPRAHWGMLLAAAEALLAQLDACQPVDSDGRKFIDNTIVRDLREIIEIVRKREGV